MFLIYLLTARSVSDSVYDNVHVNVCKPVDTLRILFTLHTPLKTLMWSQCGSFQFFFLKNNIYKIVGSDVWDCIQGLQTSVSKVHVWSLRKNIVNLT